MWKILFFVCITAIFSVCSGNELLKVVCFDEQFSLQTLAGKQIRITPGNNSKYAVRLVTAPKGKNFSAVSRKMLPRFEYSGSTAVVSADVKGRGKFRLGLHVLYRNAKGVTQFKVEQSPEFIADADKYNKFEWRHQIRQGNISQLGVIISADGENTALEFDNFVFSLRNANAVQAQFPLVEAAENTNVEVKFIKKAKLESPEAFNGVEFRPVEANSDILTVNVSPGSTHAGIIDAGSGSFSNIHYHKADAWQKIKQDAAKVKLAAPVRVLVIGDSQSDFERGHNYIDMWNYRMNLNNNGKFYVRNAGIAGDFSSMALRRLKGDKNAFGAFRYEGLENEKFDYVVVFLGHNDSRKTYRPDRKIYTPLVEPVQLRKDLEELFSLVKKRYGAKIIAVTPAVLDFEVSSGRVSSAIARGTSHTIFGDIKLLEQYSSILRETALKFDGMILDIFSAMLKNPDAKTFFQNDGVHFNRKGYEFAADEFLKFSIRNIH